MSKYTKILVKDKMKKAVGSVVAEDTSFFIQENTIYVDDYSYSIVNKYHEEIYDNEKKKIASLWMVFCKNNNINIIGIENEYYPEELLHISDYPLVLLACGNIELLKMRKISITGTIAASMYGIEVTKIVAKKISELGYVVVSGLARGIDVTGHIEAIPNTIAVIGNGMLENVIYPQSNLEIFREIKNKGGLIISEYLPDELPKKYTFPERNRIIAGISEAVIITEAKEKSSCLMIAEFACENGTDVYTIPGDILSKKYDGNNKLISDGAIPISCIDDIEKYFG